MQKTLTIIDFDFVFTLTYTTSIKFHITDNEYN